MSQELLDALDTEISAEQLDRLRGLARHTADVLKSHLRSTRTALGFVTELADGLDRIAEGGTASEQHGGTPRRR